MDNNTAVLILVGIICATIVLTCFITSIANIREVRQQIIRQVASDLVDEVVTLDKYTQWLDEKGVLREGFRKDKLVTEYTDEL